MVHLVWTYILMYLWMFFLEVVVVHYLSKDPMRQTTDTLESRESTKKTLKSFTYIHSHWENFSIVASAFSCKIGERYALIGGFQWINFYVQKKIEFSDSMSVLYVPT